MKNAGVIIQDMREREKEGEKKERDKGEKGEKREVIEEIAVASVQNETGLETSIYFYLF